MKDEMIGLLFDMDGVLVDNLEYHFVAWMKFCDLHHIPLDREEFFKNMNGKNFQDSMNYLYKKEVDRDEAYQLNEEKEQLYRENYLPHIGPMHGLKNLLEALKEKNVKMAVATSATVKNIEFTLDNTGLRPYFDSVIDATMVKQGKPAPDIYLKAAESIGVPIENCIVFEDALQGIEAGLSANMKVIGVTTSHTAEELQHTDLQISDYASVTYETLVAVLGR